jgi:hypothetical protein
MKMLLIGLTLAVGGAAAAQPTPVPTPDTPPAVVKPPPRDNSRDQDLPPEIVEKLSPVQIVEVLQRREEARIQAIQSRSGPPAVAIVVPVALFTCALLLVASFLFFRHRKELEQQTTIRLMIEKGVTVPIEFLAPRAPKHSDLRHGLVLVAAGIAVVVFLKVAHGPPGAWAFGLLPLLVGLGYLLVWKITSREENAADKPVA